MYLSLNNKLKCLSLATRLFQTESQATEFWNNFKDITLINQSQCMHSTQLQSDSLTNNI